MILNTPDLQTERLQGFSCSSQLILLLQFSLLAVSSSRWTQAEAIVRPPDAALTRISAMNIF